MDELKCPYCGEPIETYVDPSGGVEQDYVEDCSVCCRPVRFSVSYSEREGDFVVTARADR